MVLGQSAATAAAMAMDANIAVQDIEYSNLRERLLADKQVLSAPAELSRGDLDPSTMEGIVIDNPFARVSAAWKGAGSDRPRLGPAYFHDLDARDGKATARFDVKVAEPGKYRIKLLYPHHANRASNVPVVIAGGGKTFRAVVNQRQEAAWIGSFDLPAEFSVTIRNEGTNGMVVVDGLQVAPLPGN